MIETTRILYTASTDPHRNLAMEDALLRALIPGEAILFLWQNKHTVVVGAGQNAWRECDVEKLEAEGGTLARRSSGGGAVYHDMGNLNFSFIVPREDYDVARQLRVVMRAVGLLGIEAEASGRNDLTASGRKFSGNAFRLLKDSALHHGTLLVDVDMGMLGRYLQVDPDKLQAKGVRSVPARVVNLSEMRPMTVPDMAGAMVRAFGEAYLPAQVQDVEAVGVPGYAELVKQYESWEWNCGQSPAGDWNARRRFDWGAVELVARVQAGRLVNVCAYTDAMDETLSARLCGCLEGSPFRAGEMARRLAPLGTADLEQWIAGIPI